MKELDDAVGTACNRDGDEVMVEISSIVTLIGIVSIALVTPGPNNLTALIHSGIHGARANIPLIGGMATGFILLQTFIAILVNSLNQLEEWAQILHWIGVIFIILLAIVIGRLRPDQTKQSGTPRLGFKTGFAMQWINGKEWGFVVIYMTLLLDDFGGGVTGALWIISIVTTICILAIFAWSIFGAKLERFMTDPKIAPRLFPFLGAILGLLAIIVGLQGA